MGGKLLHMAISTLMSSALSYFLLDLLVPQMQISFAFVLFFSAVGTGLSQWIHASKDEAKKEE